MPTISFIWLSRWILIPALAVLASGQEEQEKHFRFMLYNHCDPLGVKVGFLPGGAPLVDLELPQLEAMVRDRLESGGLYSETAETRVQINVSRYAIRLSYMKIVADVVSETERKIATFSRDAVVADGHSASVILELSKLLNGFLSNYRRVNLLDCRAAQVDGPPSAGPGIGGGIGPRTGVGSGRGSGVGPGSGGGIGGGVFRIGGGVSSPRLLSKVEPEYSEKARKANHQGVVSLSVEIWEDGLAHNIRVVRSLGLGLDEKAVEAVKQWRFRPGKKDGKPVRVHAQVAVSFRLLQDEEKVKR